MTDRPPVSGEPICYRCGEIVDGSLCTAAGNRFRCATEPPHRPPVSGEPRICPVRIHHGPGHQSTTNCMVMEPHEVHRAEYGSYGGYAEWRGGDVFGDDGYEDDPDGWQPTYISDMTWYDPNSPYYTFMPKEYQDDRL